MADGGWQKVGWTWPSAKPPSGEARHPPAIRHPPSIWLATCSARCFVQYTIEARDLTTPRSLFDPHTIVEAPSERDAIQRYVDELHAELVSMIKPPNGGESIATIKKEDAIVLVRVYAA
jgi:hypothetical protein